MREREREREFLSCEEGSVCIYFLFNFVYLLKEKPVAYEFKEREASSQLMTTTCHDFAALIANHLCWALWTAKKP